MMVRRTGGRQRFRPARIWSGLALALLASVVLAPAALASVSTQNWTGKDGISWWSRGDNWNTSAPVAGDSLGYLNFADLGSACDSGNTYDTCYLTSNNLDNLSAYGIKLDDSLPYVIAGRTLSLGAGGITATAGPNVSGQTPVIAPALTLTATQTWKVQGGSYGQGLYVSDVSGSNGLTVNLPSKGDLYIDGAADVGNVSVSGSGALWLYGGSTASDLNGTSGNSVTLGTGTGLVAAESGNTTGPLTSNGGVVQAGIGGAPEGTLAVQGAMTLGSSSVMNFNIDQGGSSPSAGADFSQVTATGNVTLSGVKLQLFQGVNVSGNCQNLSVGAVYPLVTTTGTLSGTFSNAAGGSTLTITNNCNGANKNATAKINYTSTEVKATIESKGNAGDLPVNTSAPKISGTARQGSKLTAAHGSWTHSPSSYSYQWCRLKSGGGCNAILGATHRTYIPTAKDAGRRLYVIVQANSGAGHPEAVSAATAVIRAITRATIHKALSRVLSLSSKARRTAAILKAHGHKLTFNAPSGGKLVLIWKATVGHRHIVVAKLTSRKDTRGKRKLKLKLTKAGTNALKHSHSLEINAKANFTPTGGKTISLFKGLQLR